MKPKSRKISVWAVVDAKGDVWGMTWGTRAQADFKQAQVARTKPARHGPYRVVRCVGEVSL